MIRLLHIGDVHLGAPFTAFGDGAGARSEEVLEAFRRLPERAAAHQVHAVLVAGDLFDSPRPTAATVAVARELFRRLQAAGRPTFLVPGNHDALYRNPALYDGDLGGAILFREPSFTARTVETGGGPLTVYGLAYDWAREPNPLVAFRHQQTPGAHVALLHGSVPWAPHWGEGSALRLPLEELARLPVDYIALGDHHRYRPPERFGGEGAPAACYCGSFAALDLTEAGDHGYAVATVEPGGPTRVELHSSGAATVEPIGDVDISGCPDDEAAIQTIGARFRDGTIPIVRLVGEPRFAPDSELIRALLVERCGHAVVIDATRFYASDTFATLAAQRTIAGHVARLGVRRIEAAPGEAARGVAERALRLALAALEAQR